MFEEDLEEAMKVAFAPDFVDEEEAKIDVADPKKIRLNRYKRKMLNKRMKLRNLKNRNKLYYKTQNGNITKYRISKKNERRLANKSIRRAPIDDVNFVGKGTIYKKVNSTLINDLPLAHFSYR